MIIIIIINIRMENENALSARHAVLGTCILGIRIGLASSIMNTNTICYYRPSLLLPTLNFTCKNCVSVGRV